MSGTGAGGGDPEWCTVESDPAVFTEMLEKIGVKGVELDELYSLEDDALQKFHKVYGLIFLFKWVGEEQKKHAASSSSAGDGEKRMLDEDDIPPELFFAHQVTTNACATQAILSVVLNSDLNEEDMGTTLTELKSFTSSFPPNLKGVAITSSEEIRTAHNSFGRQDAFMHEGKVHVASKDDEAFHFVAYVPGPNSEVYELDGLQQGPIVVGKYGDGDDDNKDWLSVARKAVQARMANCGESHIKFNLMAVVQDKRIPLRQVLEAAPDDPETVQALEEENAKRKRWALENQRRKHNYVPLCVELLKELARKGQLEGLIKDAKERRAAKRLAKKSKTSE